MSFVPIGDPRRIGLLVEVQYVGDKSHGHEGGHRITMAGREVLVLPDGLTTARNRSHVITRVLHAVEMAEAVTVLGVDALVGALVREGATNILVDGDPVFAGDAGSVIAALRLEVLEDGVIRVASLGGAA